MQVGTRSSGRSLEVDSCPRNLASKRNSRQVSRPRNWFRQTSGRWSTFRPCETVQPKHAVVLFVLQPMFQLKEDIPPGSPQVPLPLPRTVPSIIGVRHTVQKAILMFLFTSYYPRRARLRVRDSRSTDSLYRRFLVAMKSEGDVRCIESEPV